MLPNWLCCRQNKIAKEKFILRAKILSLIRDFFYKEGFLEVETPSLTRLPGMEPYLDPMPVKLAYNGKREISAYLITSPEYAMKKLLVAGFPKIFQICKSFRDGEMADKFHNPEFTLLEWYRARADYRDIMRDVENLVAFIAHHLQHGMRAKPKTKNKKSKTQNKNLKIFYQGQIIDLTLPWPRLTVKEVFWKYADIDLDKALDLKSISKIAKEKGYIVNKGDRFDDVFFKVFLNEIEPHLGQGRPTILMDWPAKMAALSKKKDNDPRYAERFEVYIGGLEIGNAFSELTDPKEQKERLVDERNLRKKMGKKVYNIDKEFIKALEIGMPSSGGIAVGVDRIVMLLADSKSIEEVLFFPAKQMFDF